jgi:MSHA biogenesis protein MshL
MKCQINIIHKPLALCLVLLLNACGSVAPKDGTAIDGIHQVLEEDKRSAEIQAAEPPAEVTAALVPEISLAVETTASQPDSPRFDVSVVDAPARDFFMSLVEGTGYNMVVHPSVDGVISLNLKNVTIPEVMKILQDVYGYEHQQTGSGFYVLPIRLQSRVFQVNYLNVKRTGQSQTRVSSGQVSGGDQSGSDSDSDSDSDSSSSDNNGSTSGSQIYTSSEADFWQELTVSLTAIVGNGEGRSVVVTPQTGLVVVRAMPSELRDVERYLETTEQTMHRQVILEAKILEVQLDDGYQAGVNWAKLMKEGGTTISLGQSGGGEPFSYPSMVGIDTRTGGIVDPTTSSPVGFTSFEAFGGFFGATISTGNFLAFIELLESQGNVQVLSSPRISTLNNQKAVIKVGTDEFFVTDVDSTTTTGTSTTTSPDITLTPFFSGIALDVTPQIDANGGVTLHVHPSVSVVQDQQKDIVVGNLEQSVPLALSTVRESDSIVHAQSGQLVVIGGLMQDTTAEDVSSTPFLGDIPMVGNLFRSTSQNSRKSELVIVLRPLVVNKPEVWKRSISGSAERFRNLDRGFHFGSKPEVFGPLEGSER